MPHPPTPSPRREGVNNHLYMMFPVSLFLTVTGSFLIVDISLYDTRIIAPLLGGVGEGYRKNFINKQICHKNIFLFKAQLNSSLFFIAPCSSLFLLSPGRPGRPGYFAPPLFLLSGQKATVSLSPGFYPTPE